MKDKICEMYYVIKMMNIGAVSSDLFPASVIMTNTYEEAQEAARLILLSSATGEQVKIVKDFVTVQVNDNDLVYVQYIYTDGDHFTSKEIDRKIKF